MGWNSRNSGKYCRSLEVYGRVFSFHSGLLSKFKFHCREICNSLKMSMAAQFYFLTNLSLVSFFWPVAWMHAACRFLHSNLCIFNFAQGFVTKTVFLCSLANDIHLMLIFVFNMIIRPLIWFYLNIFSAESAIEICPWLVQHLEVWILFFFS